MLHLCASMPDANLLMLFLYFQLNSLHTFPNSSFMFAVHQLLDAERFGIAAVVILCFLCTITTRFEYELKSSETYFDYSLGRLCAVAEVNSNTHANTCKLVRAIVI